MSLVNVVRALRQANAENNALASAISANLKQIEDKIRARGVQRLIRARLPDGAELAWSQRKGRWRLVIVDDDGAIDLLSASAAERVEVVLCGALSKIVREVLS